MLGYYGYGYYFDPTYILVVIGALISLAASANVNSTYGRFANVRSMTNMTGEEVARRLLSSNRISDVSVGHVGGSLTDHYDPSKKVVNLSDATYARSSVAAIGVAAHECGHAVQHVVGYVPLKIRGALVPAANVASYIAWPILILGLLFNSQTGVFMINLGILIFSLAVLFHLVTLPVEFDASRRGLRMLEETGILGDEELRMARKVLRAAALTYVASAAAAILQLLRILILFGGRRRND
jgi:uncharacterized protein